MSRQIPKDTVLISAELKGSCYAEERYCTSFSPNDKNENVKMSSIFEDRPIFY